jgi:hypothetical protein
MMNIPLQARPLLKGKYQSPRTLSLLFANPLQCLAQPRGHQLQKEHRELLVI